ncbi:hypothetical protein [Streptomyces sp. NPDC015125]|uniref:hypothetical protein n=1 Tax=Streptomyces sp. NPDC015125 TaxID=3364938 RepID=UPI0036F8DE00
MSQNQQPNQQPSSRMAGQPAPRPVHDQPAQTDRPTFEELTAQADNADYSPLSAHLDDEVRTALGLPAVPVPVTIDRPLVQLIRDYFLDHPEKTAALPDSARDLLHV